MTKVRSEKWEVNENKELTFVQINKSTYNLINL